MSRTPPSARELLSRSLSPDELPDPRRSLDLLELAQAGDRAALEELIARYQERLRRIVRIQLGSSLLRREYDSMDIVQSTFRSALPKIGELRPHSAAGLLQWLALIATNKIRDAFDRMTSAKRDAGRERSMGSASESRADLPAAGDAPPDEQALLAEIRDLLDQEVALLPEDQRRVVVLRDYCGEGWERIAAELERDGGAARQLHQRAWIQLRKALRPKLEGRGRQ